MLMLEKEAQQATTLTALTAHELLLSIYRLTEGRSIELLRGRVEPVMPLLS